MQEEATNKLAYFTLDVTDAVSRKRVQLLQDAGLEVIGFSYRRKRYNTEFVPDWRNIELALVKDKKYFRRIGAILVSMIKIFRQRKLLGQVDYFYARNLDLCALAIFARFVSRSSAPVVYEVLDIVPVMLGKSLFSVLLRLAERWVLRRSALLVTSSPAFIAEYFVAIQSYKGDSFLLENKHFPCRQVESSREDHSGPLVITWFGAFRCDESFRMLVRLARAFPGKVEIYMRGWPSIESLADMEQEVEGIANIHLGGEYQLGELEQLYEKAHLNWCIDMSEAGNSKWLLPCRLYDSGYYHVPAIALAGTMTGNKVQELGMGWVLEEPLQENLFKLIEKMTVKDTDRVSHHIAELPREYFCDDGDHRRMITSIPR